MDAPPRYALELLGRGRDLRIPDEDYGFVPLIEEFQYDEIAAFLGDALDSDGVVVQRVITRAASVERETIVLLPVAGPWSIFERAGERIGVIASEHDGRWYVALARSAPDGAPGARTSFALHELDAWHGDDWSLRRHPLVEPAARSWTWRGQYSFGPHRITVETGASDEACDVFWRTAAPLAEVHEDSAGWQGGRFWLCFEPFAPEHVAFDGGVLLALARGALGPVRHWLVVEEDRGTPFAIGDDGASLVDYLIGDQARVDAEQAQLLVPFAIDATRGDPATAIAVELGGDHRYDDRHFDAWLAAQPATDLPRYIEVAVPRESLDYWYERLNRLQPRIVWRVHG